MITFFVNMDSMVKSKTNYWIYPDICFLKGNILSVLGAT